MFWSKTKTLVHDYVDKNKACFVTVENTLLGSVLDGLDWCGREGSNGKAEIHLSAQGEAPQGPSGPLGAPPVRLPVVFKLDLTWTDNCTHGVHKSQFWLP